jgi:hypothetical protein
MFQVLNHDLLVAQYNPRFYLIKLRTFMAQLVPTIQFLPRREQGVFSKFVGSYGRNMFRIFFMFSTTKLKFHDIF